MCLTSKWRFPRRTKKDITCYKILETDCKGEYYTPFTLDSVDISKPFKADKFLNFLSGIALLLDPYEKGPGYIHTRINRTDIKDIFIPNKSVLFECIIPKGTKYHISRDGRELCSKVIIFKRLVSSYEIYNIY